MVLSKLTFASDLDGDELGADTQRPRKRKTRMDVSASTTPQRGTPALTADAGMSKFLTYFPNGLAIADTL